MNWRHLLLPILALAAAVSAHADHAVARDGGVFVNGVAVMELSSRVRAEAAARAIRNAKEGSAVSTRSTRRSCALRIGGSTVLTISKSEAAGYGQSPSALAGKWAASLRAALQLPALKVIEESISVPLGFSREIRLVGSKAHIAQWRSVPPGLASLKRSPRGVSVYGAHLGQTTLVFSAGGKEADAQVEVLPVSATFPQNVHANVSGLPAQREAVMGSIESAIRSQLKARPGTEFKIAMPDLWPLAPGQARVVSVKVRASAPGAFPSEGFANVAIRNLGLGYAREGELWYSNNPENLAGPGLLMKGSLESEKPVRLLYHHVNESPQGLYLQVEAANNSPEIARVLVIPGDSEPDRNPVLAGIVAGERFLKRWLASSGEILEIPPMSRVPIALRRLAPKETMSGICALWLLDGGAPKLDVRVMAQPPSTPEATLSALINHETPWRFVSPMSLSASTGSPSLFEHVYPDPFKTESLTHSVGGKHGFVRIGQNPISRFDQNGSLDGNFGVLYRIEAFAENTSDAASDLEVAFEASAGYSGALFVLNGEVIRTPLLQPKTSVRILKMHLEPGQAKRFELMTMPLSGSSYPATVVMRPIEAGNRVAADLSGRWTSRR